MTPSEIAASQDGSFSKSTYKAHIAAAALGIAAVLSAPAAKAGGTITVGEDKSVSIGGALITSFTSAEGGAPDGSRSADFAVNSARIFVGGQINEYIKGTFNTDLSGGDLHVLDAFAEFNISEGINFHIGRMITPGDRANMSGGYYQNLPGYPTVVSLYPGKYLGRDDGITYWGKAMDKKLVWSAGVFMGHNRAAGLSNAGDNPLYVGRVQYSFLDAEIDPAYYLSSTYYGASNILTIGFAGNYQADGVGTSIRKHDYAAWNVDLLYESKMASWGSITVEGAFYDYGTGNVPDVGPLPGDVNIGGISDGQAYLATVAYLAPGKIGWGMMQPFVRFQEFDNDITSRTTTQWDVGFNYVIDGHNARISLDYGSSKTTLTPAKDSFTASIQLQF